MFVPPQLRNCMVVAISLLFCFLLMLLAFWVLRVFFYVVEVEGCSMMPFLESGDQVLIFRHRLRVLLQRGDIVLLESWPETSSCQGELLIKRVIGLPGDTLFVYNVQLGSLEGILDGDSYAYFASIVSPDTSVTYVINGGDEFIGNHPSMVQDVEVVKVPLHHFFVKGDWLLGGDDSTTRGPVPFNKLAGSFVTSLPQQ